MNLTRILILKLVVVTIFREIIAYVTRTIVGKSFNIAMAHRRSFPGFQMIELGSLNLFQFSFSFVY